MLPKTNIPQAGDIVGGQFRLERIIGKGSFGIVFAAQQLGLQRPVAIKMLHPRSVVNDTVVERFKREAQLASSLTNPNAVVIHAVGVHQGKSLKLPFIAMEYLRGRDLQSHMARDGVLDLAEATSVLLQSLDCLAEAHQKGIIHRDLKPENIFICEQGAKASLVKIVDFGIAKAVTGEWADSVEASLTKTGMVCGTPQFMPPEQATGQPNLSTAVDVYAMACITFEMLTGHPPFSGTSSMDVAIKHLKEPVPSLPEPYTDSFLAPIVRRALAKSPSDRYQNAAEMAGAVREAAEAAGVTPRISLNLVVRTGDDIARVSVHNLRKIDPVLDDEPPMMTRVEEPLWSGESERASPDTLSLDLADQDSPEGAPETSYSFLSRTILIAIAAGAVVVALLLATLLLVLVFLEGDPGTTAMRPVSHPTAVAVDDEDTGGEVPTSQPEDDGDESPAVDAGIEEDTGAEAPPDPVQVPDAMGKPNKPIRKRPGRRRPKRGGAKPKIPVWK